MLSERTGASEQTGKCVSDLIMWVKVVVSFHAGFVREPFTVMTCSHKSVNRKWMKGVKD